MITTFSNPKILRGVMKKLFHAQTHNTHHNSRYFVIRKYSNPNYNEYKLLTFSSKYTRLLRG